MDHYKYPNFFKTIILLIGTFLVIGCQRASKVEFQNIYPNRDTEINELKIQISELKELIYSESNNPDSSKKSQPNKSPINSITFNIGSKDDRLRIYWVDGSKTDLPCTK